MKRLLLVFLTLVLAAFLANAQVTNLKINGSSTPFSMTSGGSIQWDYDLPVGESAVCDIWYDVNANGTVDQATDRLFQSFVQTDGVTNTNGPPDLDGVANGHITFSSPVGLAPGAYIMVFTNRSVSMAITGTVAALASPAHLISGRVTPPLGKSAQGIFVELHRKQSYGLNFWNGITDVNGDYTIQMTADTAGNPWRLGLVRNPFAPALYNPTEYDVTVMTNHSGFNFVFTAASAQLTGYVKNESGSPLADYDVNLQRTDGGINRNARTNQDGFYQLGIMLSELGNYGWRVQTSPGDPFTSSVMMGQASFPVVVANDSLFKSVTVYATNSTIQGQVSVNGLPPGFPMTIIAWSADSAQSMVESDGSTGNFTIPVTNKIFDYQVFAINFAPNYHPGPNALAHPGDTGVRLSMTATSVGAPAEGVPTVMVLDQNYPNPFNPSTTIRYVVPGGSQKVALRVFDLLGRQVATLVDGTQSAGEHLVTWNASGQPSGVYFYRLTAGPSTETKRLILMK